MGSGPIALTGSSGSGWRWWRCNGNNNSKHNNTSVNMIISNNNGSNQDSCVFSWSFCYFLVSFLFLGLIASLHARFLLTPNVRTSLSALGCREDNEGSWSIGVFYGDSPFTLKPIEEVGSDFSLFPSSFTHFGSGFSFLWSRQFLYICFPRGFFLFF